MWESIIQRSHCGSAWEADGIIVQCYQTSIDDHTAE